MKLEEKLEGLARKSFGEGGRSVVPTVMERIGTMPLPVAGGEGVSETGQEFSQMRRWMMRGTVGLAACAAVVAIVVAVMLRPTLALAEVLQKVEKTRTLTMEVQEDAAGGAEKQGGEAVKRATSHVYFKGDMVRAEYSEAVRASSNGVSVGNLATGEWVALDSQNRTVYKIRMRSIAFDFYGILKDFKDGKEERLGPTTLKGKEVVAFRVTRDLPNLAKGGTKEPVQITLWVDPATSLPVEAEMEAFGTKSRLLNLKWDQPLEDGLFSMETPEGWKVEDIGGIDEKKLETPATQAGMEIKPGEGVGSGDGELRLGDSAERVEKLFGKPEQHRTAVEWGYPSRGFYLLVHPTKGVDLITMNSKKGAGPFAMNDFMGKTAEGIGMGSSREAVEKAYGKPDREDGKEGSAALYYDRRGIWMVMREGEVVQMMVSKGSGGK